MSQMTLKGNDERAVDKALWRLAKWSFGVGVLIIVGAWSGYWGTLYYQYKQGKTSLEYTIRVDKLADFLPQNVATVVKITSGNLNVTEGTFVTIGFWNRAVTNLDHIDVRVTTEDGAPAPYHKLLLYPPESLDKDWVDWAKPADNSDLDFGVDVLDSNWNSDPNISVRYFYPGPAPKHFEFKTKKPGVEFTAYDTMKVTPWFFGLDVPLEVTAGVLVYIAVIYGGAKFGTWYFAQRCNAYSRALWNSMLRNFHELDGTTKERMLWLSVQMFTRSIRRWILTPQTDPEIVIPPQIGKVPIPEDGRISGSEKGA
jgi:hypothetical protein